MKKLLYFFLLFFFVATASHAQHHSLPAIYFSEDRKEYIASQQQKRDSVLKRNLAKTVEREKYYNKRGKLKRDVVSREWFYDSLGNTIKQKSYSPRGKLRRIFKFGYNVDGVQKSYRAYNIKMKLIEGWDLVFNEKGLMSKAIKYENKEGRVSQMFTYEYNSDSNVVKRLSLNRRGKVRYTREYDYYEDGQKKEMRTYNAHGKLVRIAKYNHLPKGIKLVGTPSHITPDTMKLSHKDSSDAEGNYIYTTERTRPNGKIWKYITKINPSKKSREHSLVTHKGKLVYKDTFVYGEDGLLKESIQFDSQQLKWYQLVRYTYEWSEDEKKFTTSQYDSKNRLRLVTTTTSY